MEQHQIVSREAWLAARRAHLLKEKELTRARDELHRQRRDLPWVRIDKEYVFDGPAGKETLADLFEDRSQLIVQHFMFGPGWKEGCVGCSFQADHIAGALMHLEHHDVSFAAVSRAPLAEIDSFRRRMGWHFHWVSSFGSDFNYDFHVSYRPEDIAGGKVDYNFGLQDFQSEELSGISVFYKDSSGAIFHTYSAFARGDEMLIGAYNYLDMTPKGRNETGPRHNLTDWVRHHDRYEADGKVDATGRFRSAQPVGGCCASVGQGSGRATS